jgi:hypothetical protein
VRRSTGCQARCSSNSGRVLPGKRLGQSFRVKLWPTLVFKRDGEVIKQVARPESGDVRQGLEAMAGIG